jgi:hypothetical protein
MSVPEWHRDRDGEENENAVAHVRFDRLDDDLGLEIVDPIDRHRYSLYTETPVEPRPAAERFSYPVDAAVEFETTGIDFATVVAGSIRDEDGTVVANLEHLTQERLGEGRYSVEPFIPIKCYLQVDGPVQVSAGFGGTSLRFERPQTVTVGARSLHKRPAATVTTTGDPVDLMAAVSTFGSALKTIGPERSYPTLRGHPPAIEVGDELEVPAGLEPPATGLRIEVPPERRAVYVVAPLAYYLGARVEPGPIPRLVSDDGRLNYALERPLGFERTVERVLKRTFFLDCLTRTEGGYGAELHERTQVESAVDIDFERLYDASLSEQIAAYLAVPFEAIEPHLPEWKLTTHVSPDPSSAETLPFLVNDLAVVRSPQVDRLAGTAGQELAVSEFLRTGEFTRSVSASNAERAAEVVSPEATDSLEQAWVGEETPSGASKATAEAYRHRLDRAPKQGDIDITVVCNDGEMAAEEGVVDDAYGDRAELPFDVHLRRGLTRAELRETLEAETDFLHYIGHIDDAGFQCVDGALDARDLDAVGVDAFLLNACSSYEQGMALIDAGGIGGVVTLADVINSGAIRIGKAVARLLNRGFPLNAALEVARDESIVGSQYIVIGDGGFAITQAESGTPVLFDIDRGTTDDYAISVNTYTTSQYGLGSSFVLFSGESPEHCLVSANREREVSENELLTLLSREDLPVRYEGTLHWSQEFGLSDL